MTLMERLQQLAGAGKGHEAVALVESLAAEDDVEALLLFAHWRLWGLYGPRDHGRVHDLLERAAAAGSAEAALLRATLTANGTGTGSDLPAAVRMLREIAPNSPEAARQLDLLDSMPPPESAADLPSEEISADPAIRMVRGFLGAAECAWLRDRAQSALRPSMIVDPRTGRAVPDPRRTSAGMQFDPSLEDPVVHAINLRIAAVTGTAVECGEMLNVLRYEPGQEYRPHLDALPGVTNQRHITALIYLNEDYAAGETRFPALGISARGGEGDCLIFHNAGPDGRPDERALHAGLPVATGVKWLASRWIRRNPYNVWEERPGA